MHLHGSNHWTKTFFLKDSAIFNFFHSVKALLSTMVPSSCMVRERYRYVGPRSPDLTPFDIALLVYIKSRIYGTLTELPHGLAGRFRIDINEMIQNKLQTVYGNIELCLRYTTQQSKVHIKVLYSSKTLYAPPSIRQKTQLSLAAESEYIPSVVGTPCTWIPSLYTILNAESCQERSWRSPYHVKNYKQPSW